MNRRELLKMIAAATGTALVGGNAILLAGCERATAPREQSFDAMDIALLDEVAETIIPRTDTPGAKDAQVGQFMTVMVNDCYTPEEQAIFHEGLPRIEAASRQSYSTGFMQLSPEDRQTLVAKLDKEAKAYSSKHSDPHYFTLIKQLTLLGFFTSKVGATEVLRYDAIPGGYDGCMDYEEGDRAWAT